MKTGLTLAHRCTAFEAGVVGGEMVMVLFFFLDFFSWEVFYGLEAVLTGLAWSPGVPFFCSFPLPKELPVFLIYFR